jgi:hypothetical protein
MVNAEKADLFHGSGHALGRDKSKHSAHIHPYLGYRTDKRYRFK